MVQTVCSFNYKNLYKLNFEKDCNGLNSKLSEQQLRNHKSNLKRNLFQYFCMKIDMIGKSYENIDRKILPI